jgi:hypothetical protein
MFGMEQVEWINAHPSSLFLLLPLYFVALMWIISRVSGWALLSRRFSTPEPFNGKTWGWQSARFRGWCNYNNCLNVGANPEGVYLSILLPFRLFHPALMIPWREIEVETGKALFGLYDTARFRIGTEERVTLRIYGKLVNRVRDAAGSAWPLYTIEQLEAQTKR